MTFRKIVFYLHLPTGVTAGLVILSMSVTGVLLAFQRQITAYLDREAATVSPPASDAQRLSLDALVAKAREAVPEGQPASVILRPDPTTAATVSFGREKGVYVDPYTGAVKEGSKAARTFFREVEDWHRWFGAGEQNRAVWRAVTGACNAAFAFMVVTGFYLWWPRRWTRRMLRSVAVPDFKLRGRERDWNWHNAFGCWSAPALICITLTGVVMSYPWANNLIYTLTGSEPPPPRPQESAEGRRGPARADAERKPRGGENAPGGGGASTETPWSSPKPASLDTLFAAAVNQSPRWKTITLRLPQRSAPSVTVTIEEADAPHPFARSSLTLNAATAGVVKWEPFSGYNLGRRIRSWVRATHTGEAGGLIGQVIAALAAEVGAVMVCTGLSLAWRRFRNFRTRNARAANVSAEGAAPIPHSVLSEDANDRG